MEIEQYDDGVASTQPSSSHLVSNHVFVSILDKDYDSIESELFGSVAIDCLDLLPENPAAPPQGSPFLRLAQPLSSLLRRYKGVYSI